MRDILRPMYHQHISHRSQVQRSWSRYVQLSTFVLIVCMALTIAGTLAGCGQLTGYSQSPSSPVSSIATQTYATSGETVRPAPGCSPAPSTATPAAGPLLYWVPSPQSQGSHVRPQALCGVGFQSDEQVTVSVETTKGSSAPSGLPTLTVSANSQGSFAADYVPEVPCASAQQQFEVRAHGNKGSTSSVSMPPTLQTGCAPA